MASKYAAQYIERAKREVKNFEVACRVLRFDPEKESDFDAIVTSMVGIGQFVTNEEEFLMVAEVGLHFYWMTLDFWQEIRQKQGAAQIF